MICFCAVGKLCLLSFEKLAGRNLPSTSVVFSWFNAPPLTPTVFAASDVASRSVCTTGCIPLSNRLLSTTRDDSPTTYHTIEFMTIRTVGRITKLPLAPRLGRTVRRAVARQRISRHRILETKAKGKGHDSSGCILAVEFEHLIENFGSCCREIVLSQM